MTEPMKQEPGEVVAYTEPVTPMEMLARAVDRGVDAQQLEKLMDLQERYETTQNRKAFVEAMTAFRAEAPQLVKTKQVGFESRRTGDRTDYKYTPLDKIAGQLAPILSKHGLSYSWETTQAEGGLISVTCVLTHVMGHCERVMLQAAPDTSGNKNSIQAVGSTVTYLQRYTLLAALGLATAEQDTDGMMPVDLINAEQKEQMVALIRETGADTTAFCKYLGVAALDELPVDAFDNAVAALEKKRRQA